MAADEWIGREILGYRVESLVGRGGMGVVYRAYDLRLKRSVALKLVAPELSQDDGFRARFLEETGLAASLEHPNVVPIYDAGEVDGPAVPRHALRRGTGPEGLWRATARSSPRAPSGSPRRSPPRSTRRTSTASSTATSSPRTCSSTRNEHVYLTDFGLARRLGDECRRAPAGSLGTPAYASPEQVTGGDVDGRADVYGLGCLLYECLAGTVPFPRSLRAGCSFRPPPGAAAADRRRIRSSTPSWRPRSRRTATTATRAAASWSTRPGRRSACATSSWFGIAGRSSSSPWARWSSRVRSPPGSCSRSAAAGRRSRARRPTLTPKVDSLQRIDPKTNELAATIGVDSSPTAVAVGYDHVWVGSDERSVRPSDRPRKRTRSAANGRPPGRTRLPPGSVRSSSRTTTAP